MTAFLFCTLLSLVPGLIRAQELSSFAGSGEHSDIVTENLKRVAATAEQILDILNRNTGLMVELKRWIAQDAGESGQVLEESDLNDNALVQRLNQDLRTRVIATRLLRRYGYLLPQLNPDSDPAQEQKLVLQERTQELAPAEERSAGLNGPASLRQQEIQNSPRGPRVDTAGKSSTGTPAATASSLPAGRKASLPGDGVAAPVISPLAGDFEKRSTRRPAAVASGDNLESVRIAHRPNPYAAIPSLYDLYVQAGPSGRRAERFGLEAIRHAGAYRDALPMDLPVGPEYVLGPGDGLSIDIWGGVSAHLLLTVDREGKVALPEAGPLLVSGKSLGEAQLTVQRALRTEFRDVSADVSLLKLRTVRVHVVGEVGSPGAYDVSSLSTPLNALAAAGGVAASGSLRHLEHYRGNHLLEKVDGYDLLLHGARGDMERLENGDSLRVPLLGASATVDGMVRRPAVYELRGETNLSQVLDLAGGLLPAAALRHVEVQRLEAHEKRTMLSLEVGEATDQEALRLALENFKISDGDEIHIFPIAPYNTEAVYLEGHVLRPGRYAYREGMKLGDLIVSRSDLLPEPSERYAEIIHLQQPENRPVVESFPLAAALEHPQEAPKLQPLDTVRIFGRYDFEDPPEFSVFGEVYKPGRYRSPGQAHLRDAIYVAGGLTPEAWEDSGQLFRTMPDGSTKVFSISLPAALAGDPLNNLLVEPRDRILVHRQPERVNPPSVYVGGEVARPGRYPLTAGMKISDLIRSAGGLLRSANPSGGDLTHYAATAGMPRLAESQTVDVSSALAGQGSADLTLRDGDLLTVPERTGWKNVGASVTISGEVAKPGVYGIQPGERLSSLLERAGGLLPTAYPQAAVFERISVYESQQKGRQELIERLERESTVVKTAVNTTGTEEAALQQAAIEQRQRILDALRRAPISARLVIHLHPEQKGFAASADDIELRAGDSLKIPKLPGFVVIVGQVYNSNAITFTPKKKASWYLSQSGGATRLADTGAIFIIRANGSVTSGRNGMSYEVLSSEAGPGDTIVVPEKVIVGGSGWKNSLATAQMVEATAVMGAMGIP